LTVEIGFQIDPLTAWLLGNLLLVVAVVLVQTSRNRGRPLLSGAARLFKLGDGWLGSERSLRSAAPSRMQSEGSLPSTVLVLLSWFAASMLLVSSNVLELLLFWQLTALCGYLLSGSGGVLLQNPGAAGVGRSEAKETPVLRTSPSSLGHPTTIDGDCTSDRTSAAARRTLLLRWGMDLLLIPAVYLVWTTFGSLELDEILGRGSLPSEKLAGLLDPAQPADLLAGNRVVLSVICLCLVTAAVGRCGLFPLFRRRDDLTGSSAAVQALLQSAVVMPAGLHLIVRWHRLFAVAPVAQTLMLSLGGATALLAVGIAVAENHSRRRLVFVNTALFGLMFAVLGFGARFSLLIAVGFLSVSTLAMAVLVLAAGDFPVTGEDEEPAIHSREPARRWTVVVFEPLARLCRRRFYLDAIGTQLFVLPMQSISFVCHLLDRYLLDGLIPLLFRRLPGLVAETTEPLRNQPARFNAISLILSSVVLTVLLVWLWR